MTASHSDQEVMKEMQIRQLSIQMEKLEREYQEILSKTELTHDQIKNYVENPTHFSGPIWERLQMEKTKLNEKLELAEKNTHDTKQLKKTFSERSSVRPHWIYVR